MRKETIQLESMNGTFLRFITVRDAFEFINEGKAKPLKDRYHHICGVRLTSLLRSERPSPCTLTKSDAENNAMVHNGARIEENQSIRSLDRAANKVAAWPSVHDSKATVVSAGTVYGVFCPFPPMEERVVTFA
jgi:hypothetical protein